MYGFFLHCDRGCNVKGGRGWGSVAFRVHFLNSPCALGKLWAEDQD